MAFFQALLYLFLPAILIIACKRISVLRPLGPVVMCYLSGVILGNLPWVSIDKKVAEVFYQAAIPLAIPLLLLTSQPAKWLKLAPGSLLSFFFCLLAVTLAAGSGYFLFQHQVADAEIVAAMLCGVFTGGTPNMSAIGFGLGISEEVFAMLNATDMLLSGAYLIFVTGFAQRFLSIFLPVRKPLTDSLSLEAEDILVEISLQRKVFEIAKTLLLGVFMMAISIGLTWLIRPDLPIALLVLSLTTIGIGGSLMPKVKTFSMAYPVANYLLLIFCVAIGSLAGIDKLAEAGPVLLKFTAWVIGVSVLVHWGLGYLAKIDADTVIVTSSAGIFGPVFIGQVAMALNRPDLIAPGITCGLLGYAAGNYLGFFLAWFLST